MLEKYEDSRYFKWGLARAYQDVNKHSAIEVYSQLLESVETRYERNQYNDIVLKHKLAMLYYEVNNLKEALKYCNEILDFDFNSIEIKERLTDRRERTQELREQIRGELSFN